MFLVFLFIELKSYPNVHDHFIIYQWKKYDSILSKTEPYFFNYTLKYIHKVKFYPSRNNFKQALLVTNIISELTADMKFSSTFTVK